MLRAIFHTAISSLAIFPLAAAEHSDCGDECGSHDHSTHSAKGVQIERDEEDEAWLRFYPHLSAAIAIGGSTSRKNLDLVPGGHAPLDDGFNLQGIEVGGVIGLGESVSILAEGNFFWDRFDGWDAELEEAYATEHSIRLQFVLSFGHAGHAH